LSFLSNTLLVRFFSHALFPHYLALLKLFELHRKDGRVILPLLKTLDVLLSHGVFDSLMNDSDINFSLKLMAQLRMECRGCRDVQRLVAAVSVALGLIVSDETGVVEEDVLPFLMVMLAHRYPRVRRWTAEQLYVHLLEGDSTASGSYNDGGIDRAMELLMEVSWDDDLDSPGNVRDSRNCVADFLGIQLSEKERNGIKKKAVKKTGAIDEFASYASLVDAAGR
jgi:hypothetical protein